MILGDFGTKNQAKMVQNLLKMEHNSKNRENFKNLNLEKIEIFDFFKIEIFENFTIFFREIFWDRKIFENFFELEKI